MWSEHRTASYVPNWGLSVILLLYYFKEMGLIFLTNIRIFRTKLLTLTFSFTLTLNYIHHLSHPPYLVAIRIKDLE